MADNKLTAEQQAAAERRRERAEREVEDRKLAGNAPQAGPTPGQVVADTTAPGAAPLPPTPEQAAASAQNAFTDPRTAQARPPHVAGAPVGAPLAPGAVLGPDEETVTMTFPAPVILTMDDHRRVRFPAGVQEVPERLANHPYLRANGVVRYEGRNKRE